MFRHLLLLALLMDLSAEEYPPGVQQILADLNATIVVERQKAAKVLEEEVTRAMKSQKLDIAVATKAALDEQNRLIAAGALLPRPNQAIAIVGSAANIEDTLKDIRSLQLVGQPFLIGKEILLAGGFPQASAVDGFQRLGLREGMTEIRDLAGHKASYVGLVTRDYGALREKGDYADDVVIEVNGTKHTLDRWGSNSALFLPVPGGVVQGFTVSIGDISWGPALDQLVLIP